MDKRVFVAASFILGVSAQTAMAQSPPPWCAKAEGRIDSDSKRAFTEKDARWAVFYLVGSYCKPDSDAKSMAKELESAKKKWSAKLDMQEQDWADAAEWASMDQGSRMNRDLKHDKKRAWSSLTPGQQFGLIDFDFNEDGPAYAADALGAKLSEVGRFAYIQKCIKANDSQQAAWWAMCQPDIDAFDKKKFSDQLRVDTGITGAERMEIRLRYEGFADQLKKHAEDVKALQAKDGGYATMFTTAAQGYADFAKADQAAVQLMADMDDARVTNSRKAFDGCSDRVWPAWKKAVSAIPAKKFANFKREPGDENLIVQALAVIIGEPNGYLATVSLFICEGLGMERGKDMDYLVKASGNTASRWPGFRGPRTSALTAMMLNGVTLDDRDARIEYPQVNYNWMSQNMSSGGGGRGVVAKVDVKGEKATVTFKKEFEKQEQCQSWKSSKKIVQITSSGSVIYESWCTSSKSVTVDKSFGPQTVKARYVEGLKPGMAFSNTEDVAGLVYAKSGAKLPHSICSAVVK